jgi:hypothetical protein
VLNSGSFCSSIVASRCCKGKMLSSSLMKLSPVAYLRHLCNTTQHNSGAAAQDPFVQSSAAHESLQTSSVRALTEILCLKKQQYYPVLGGTAAGSLNACICCMRGIPRL